MSARKLSSAGVLAYLRMHDALHSETVTAGEGVEALAVLLYGYAVGWHANGHTDSRGEALVTISKEIAEIWAMCEERQARDEGAGRVVAEGVAAELVARFTKRS